MWCAGIKKNEDIQVVKEHHLHINRLHTVKSRIDNNPPKEIMHLKKKLKTKAIIEGNQLSIQKKNGLLLQRMMEISSRPPQYSGIVESVSTKSLNVNQRTQNLWKITEENQLLLNKLQRVKSNYSNKKWDEQFRYKTYLSRKLSENSRRIPKVSSVGITSSFESSRTPHSRPETASIGQQRPSSTSGIKNRIEYDL